METRAITVLVPEELSEQAEQFAREHGTTVARLVIAYLTRPTPANDPLAGAPIVRRLSASLSPDVTPEEDYRRLRDKPARAR